MPLRWSAAFLVLSITGCGAPPPPKPPPPPPVEIRMEAPTSKHMFEPQLPSKSALGIEGRREWYRWLRWPLECEQSFNRTAPPDHPERGGIEFFAGRDDKHWTVRVACTAGVGQPASVWMLLDESTNPIATSLLVFPTFSAFDGKVVREDTPILGGEDVFAAKRGEIGVVTRAPNGCGTASRYSLQGTRVVLAELRARVRCDGRESDPATWTQLVP